MLVHQVAPLHASLTDTQGLKASPLHKCVLGFMGDRKYPNRNDLAVELIIQVRVVGWLVGEVGVLVGARAAGRCTAVSGGLFGVFAHTHAYPANKPTQLPPRHDRVSTRHSSRRRFSASSSSS